MELADTGSGKLPEKREDSPKTEDTGLSANSGLTESPKNASKDLILEKVSVLMSGFTGKEGLASRQRQVSNITKVIRGSGLGYVSKDHPRAMQIAWKIVKKGLDVEKLRSVQCLSGNRYNKCGCAAVPQYGRGKRRDCDSSDRTCMDRLQSDMRNQKTAGSHCRNPNFIAADVRHDAEFLSADSKKRGTIRR